jgi:hypothetical protein
MNVFCMPRTRHLYGIRHRAGATDTSSLPEPLTCCVLECGSTVGTWAVAGYSDVHLAADSCSRVGVGEDFLHGALGHGDEQAYVLA